MLSKKSFLVIIGVYVCVVSFMGLFFWGCKGAQLEETSSVNTTVAETTAQKTEAVTETSSEIITLRYPHWFFGHGGSFEEWINGAVDAFEAENPNIRVEREQVPFDIYWDKLSTSIAGGNPPDVAAFGPVQLGKFISAGSLLPLNDLINMEDVNLNFSSLQKESIPSAAPDGKTYGLAFDSGFYLPLYRPSVFKEAGIEKYANTPEEFIEMTKKLTGKGKYGYAFMVKPGNYTEAYIDYVIWTIGLGGHFGTNDGKPALNSPEVIKAMSYLKQLFDAKVIPLDTDKGTYREMFATKAVATIIDGMWMYGLSIGWDPSAEGDFMTAPLPFPTQRVAGFYECNSVMAGSKYPKEAAKLVEYLSNTEQQERLVRICQLIPPRTSVFTDQLKSELIEQWPWYKEFINHADNAILFVPPAMDMGKVEEVTRIWNIYMERILFENADVTITMNNAQDEAMKLFK